MLPIYSDIYARKSFNTEQILYIFKNNAIFMNVIQI